MEHEESEISSGEELGRHEPTSTMRLPLNSRRLKAEQLRRLAAVLDVPTTASADELRQMIDGKLTGEGKVTQNIQVVFEGTDLTSKFSLEDEEGRFLTIPMRDEQANTGACELNHTEDGEEQQADILRRELQALTEENQTLKEEVSRLKQQLHDEKARFRSLWRTNCQCLAEYDGVILAKECEIEELKCQLHSQSIVSDPHPDPACEALRGEWVSCIGRSLDS